MPDLNLSAWENDVSSDDLPLNTAWTSRRDDREVYGAPSRARVSVFSTVQMLAGLTGLVALAVFPLGWKEQAIAGGALIAGAALLSQAASATVTPMLMTLSLFCTARYAYWRVTQTWDGITSAGHLDQWDSAAVLLLLLAEFYAFATLALGYFQTLRPLRRRPLPLGGHPGDWPTVDVFIPTYNEPLHVVRATILAALALDYPADKLRVVVLDDGGREEFRAFAAKVGAGYIARERHDHAKAGNINHALGQTSGEYIAIFDCDHIPTRSFLQTTLGWLVRDQRLGLVQTPHHFYSPDPFERNLRQFRRVPNEGELFHRLVQDGNDLWNASFFCGSCAVLRRRALDAIGGIAVETVTEDAHTALRMQRRGWDTAYINVPQAAGLATESLAAHIGQRIRWARGMAQILRVENPLFATGLSLSQRLCYFNAATHFLFAVPRLIFLIVPLLYLLFGIVNIYGYSLAVFAYALPHIALSHLTNARVQRGYRSSCWNEIYEAVLAPYILLPTLLALINPRLGKFNVTSKGGVVHRSYFDRRVAMPLVLLLGLNIAGLFMARERYLTDLAHRDTVIMNALWAIYNVVILAVAASVARERRQRRSEVRVGLRVPFALITTDGTRIAGMTVQLSRGGAAGQLDRRAPLDAGDPALLVLHAHGTRCDIPARVVRRAGRAVRLSFPHLELWQERYLVNLIYARPGAWLPRAGIRTDAGPFRNSARILWLSVRGLAVVTFGMITPRLAPRPESPTRQPRGPQGEFPSALGWEPPGPQGAFPSALGREQRVGPRRGALRPEGQARKRAPALAAGATLVALLIPTPATARQAKAAPEPDHLAVYAPASSVFSEQYPVGTLGALDAATWRERGAALNLFFAVPVTKVISKATLELRYAAPMLRPNEAQVELWLNGTRVGLFSLAAGSDVRVEVPLPTDLLTNDNTLSLRLEGRCAECLRARKPWLTLAATSSLSISGTKLPLTNDLSLLPIPLIDLSSQRASVLPVVFAEHPDRATLEAAAMVASWFGVLSDVRGARFPVSVNELPEGNALVFVARGSALADGLSLPAQDGPVIAMRDNPRDPFGKLLIIAGTRTADFPVAARALVTSGRFSGHADAVRALGVPPVRRRAYDAPRWLKAEAPSPIGTYTTVERLTLRGSGSLAIYFRLPPDLFLSAHQSVPLLLKFGYSGVRPGAHAALHVRLNGHDIDTIRLRPEPRQMERADVVRLPTGWLRTYTNTLMADVDFGQRDSDPGATGPLSPYLAIHQDSSIDFRGIPHSVALPKLELFADAGYPFTVWPDLGRTAVVLPDAPGPTDYEMVLNMVGFFGAQTGTPVTAITTVGSSSVETVRDDDLVVIGDPASQPLVAAWADRMPLGMFGDRIQLNDRPGLVQQLYPAWPFGAGDHDRLARLFGSGTGVDVLVEGFVSPFRPDRSVVAIVPASGSSATAASLFLPGERQGPIYGGLAIAQNGRFQSFLLNQATYRAGDFDRYQRTTVFLIEHYWLIPLLAAAFACAIGRWTRQRAESVALRRLAMRTGMLLVLLVLAILAPGAAAAQGTPGGAPGAQRTPPRAPSSGIDVLLGKARSLEARGRMDLAAQNWNQVLLVDPKQTEALAGLARYAKQNGDTAGERAYLDRLRLINPKDSTIASVEKMRVLSPQERRRLDEAGRLAAEHKPDEAMKVYREVLGDAPPPGKWAEPFYETEAASTGGRAMAIQQLRQLASRDARNEVYRLWLARILTYDPKTRMEAFELLQSIDDAGAVEQARTVWRRALAWEKDNPAVLASLEAYIARYRDDELQKSLNELRAKRERAVRDASEQQAFQALRSKDTVAAQDKFEQILRRSPTDVSALAGLGFVRLDQKRFDQALGLFERARVLAPERSDLREGYETAKFWLAMRRGADLERSDAESAISAYQEALGLHPSDPQPVLGIAQIRLRQGQLAEAGSRFAQVMAQTPADVDAVAGLGYVRLKEKKFDEAATLLARARSLAPGRKDIDDAYRTAKYWGLTNDAGAALRANRPDAAIAGYQQALEFGPGGKDALLGLAAATERKGVRAESVKAYEALTAAHPDDAVGWLGLLRTQVGASHPEAAIETSRRIPPAIRQQLEPRADYLANMALAFYGAGRPSEGERTLRQALGAAASGPDSEEALAVRLQVAGVLLREGKAALAIPVYEQATRSRPQNPVAWQGLIGAYSSLRNDAAALAVARSIPRSVYDVAMKNTTFLGAMATIYANNGRCADAEGFLTRSLTLEKEAGRQPAETTELHLADIWMRERQFDKASRGYREVVSRNAQSVEGWRGYVTALHNHHDDRTVVAEAGRMPAAPRTALQNDPDFLRLLGSAHAAVGRDEEAAALLAQARARYRAEGKVPSTAFDVQLGWALLAAPNRQEDLQNLLAETHTRTDFSPDERAALDEMRSISTVQRAEAALRAHGAQEAVAILLDAGSEHPDSRIRSALAGVYLRQHQYEKALDVYRTWGMAGADAGEYRSAAGAALAAHQTALADALLSEGRQHWPNDPELLRMAGRQATAQGRYREGAGYLKEALSAAETQPASRPLRVDPAEPAPTVPPPNACPADARANDAGATPAGTPAPTPATTSPRPGTATAEHGPSASSDPQSSDATANPARATGTQPRPETRQGGDTRQATGTRQGNDTPQGTRPGNDTPATDARQTTDTRPGTDVEPGRDTQQLQDDLDVVEHRNTPFVSVGVPVTVRGGDPGLTRLVVTEGAVGGSAVIANTVRIAVNAHAVSLSSGTPDGQSGYRFGTLPAGATFPEQKAAGRSGELQVSTNEVGATVGISPSGFLTQTWTAGIRLGPADAPVRLVAIRDSVKDSLLSYAGTRDPATGVIWGGVVSNSVALQVARNEPRGGLYASATAALLRGQRVEDNWDVEAVVGGYRTLATLGQGALSLGMNATGMHYDRNSNFFSLGHGGYFSPQQYLVASVPVGLSGREGRVAYQISASAGYQYIVESAAPYYPDVAVPVPVGLGQPSYDASKRIGLNYNLALRLDYHILPHWYLGSFVSANNAYAYQKRALGVTLTFLAQRLPTDTGLHPGPVPDWRGSPPLTF